jgi:hypothetical protein
VSYFTLKERISALRGIRAQDFARRRRDAHGQRRRLARASRRYQPRGGAAEQRDERAPEEITALLSAGGDLLPLTGMHARTCCSARVHGCHFSKEPHGRRGGERCA